MARIRVVVAATLVGVSFGGEARLPTCIVGGGIGGVATADYIRRHIEDEEVIIFEKAARLGGKIQTSYAGNQTTSGGTSGTAAFLSDGGATFESEGPAGGGGFIVGAEGQVPQELGACYTSPDYTRLMALLDELDLFDQLDTVPPRLVHGANGAPGVSLSAYALSYLLTLPAVQAQLDPGCLEAIATDPTTAEAQQCTMAVVVLILTKMGEYEALHVSLFGSYTSGARPPRIDDLSLIDGTFGEFLDRNDLSELRPILDLFQESQGYGALDAIPAYYGLLSGQDEGDSTWVCSKQRPREKASMLYVRPER